MKRVRCWLRIVHWWLSPPEGWKYDGMDPNRPAIPYPECKP